MGNTRSEACLSAEVSRESWEWTLNDEQSFKPRHLLEASDFSRLFAKIKDRINNKVMNENGLRQEFDLRAAGAQNMIQFQAEHQANLPQDPNSKTSPQALINANYDQSFQDSGEFLGKNLSFKPSTTSSVELATTRLKMLINAHLSAEQKLNSTKKNLSTRVDNRSEELIKALAELEESKATDGSATPVKEDYKLRLLPLIIDELLDSIHSLQQPAASLDGLFSSKLATLMEGLFEISQNFGANESIPSSSKLVLSSVGRLVQALHSLYENTKLSGEYVRTVLILISKLSVLGSLLGWQFWSLAQLLKTDNVASVEDAFLGLKHQAYEKSCKEKGFPLFYHKLTEAFGVPEVCPSGKFKDVILLRTKDRLLAVHDKKFTVLEKDLSQHDYRALYSVEWEKDAKPLIIKQQFWCVDDDLLFQIQDAGALSYKDYKTKFGIKLPKCDSPISRNLLNAVVKVVGDSLTNPDAVHYIENSPIPGVLIRIIHCDALPSSIDPAKSTTKQMYRLLQFLALESMKTSTPSLKIIGEMILKPFQSKEHGMNSAYFANKAMERYTFIGPKHFVGLTKTQTIEIFDITTGHSVCQPFMLHEITSRINFDWRTQQIVALEGDNQLAEYDFTNATEFFSDLDINLCYKDGNNISKPKTGEEKSDKTSQKDAPKEVDARLQAELTIKELGLIDESNTSSSPTDSSAPPAWLTTKDYKFQLQAMQEYYTSKGTEHKAVSHPDIKYPDVPAPYRGLRQVLDCMLINTVASFRISGNKSLAPDAIAKELSNNKQRYDLSVDCFQKLSMLVRQLFNVQDVLLTNTCLKMLDLYLEDLFLLQHDGSSIVIATQETLFNLREDLSRLQSQCDSAAAVSVSVDLKGMQKSNGSLYEGPEKYSPVQIIQQGLVFSLCQKLLEMSADCTVLPWKMLVDNLFSQHQERAYQILDRLLRSLVKCSEPTIAPSIINEVFGMIQSHCIKLIQKAEALEVESLKSYSPMYPLSLKLSASMPYAESQNLQQVLSILTRLTVHHHKESFTNPVFQASYQASLSFLKGLGVCLRKNHSSDVDSMLWGETVLGGLFYSTLILSLFDDQRSAHEDTTALVESFMEIAEHVPSS